MNKFAKILSVVLSATIALSVAVVMLVSAFAATTPVFSLNIVDETDESVVVSVKLEEGAFTSLNLEVISKTGNCKKIVTTSAYDAVEKDIKAEDGAAINAYNKEGAKATFGAALTPAFAKAGEELILCTFEKTTKDSVSNEDITLVITCCNDGDGAVVTEKTVVKNNLPAPVADETTTTVEDETTTTVEDETTTVEDETTTTVEDETTTTVEDETTTTVEDETTTTVEDETTTTVEDETTTTVEDETTTTVEDETTTTVEDETTTTVEDETTTTVEDETTTTVEDETTTVEDETTTEAPVADDATTAPAVDGAVVNPDTGDSATATAAIASLLAISAAAVVALRKKED